MSAPERTALWCGLLVALTCAAPPVAAASACAIKLRLIGMHEVAPATRVNGDLFGGISGLDYDTRTREWYLVSDDRSEHGPARFFIARFDFDSRRLRKVTLRTSIRFKGSKSNSSLLSGHADDWIDAESVRIDHHSGELLVASEGDEQRQTASWIRRVDRGGRWLGEVSLPTLLASGSQQGPRPNRALEGLAFAPHGRALWVALESPLLQDGKAASVLHGADVRLTRIPWPDGAITQYVYLTDAARAHGPDESADNGISEILGSGEHELLVLERSGIRSADGQFRFHTRLYCADASDATDVASFESLVGRRYLRVTKQLALDFDSLQGVIAGNLEAMGWGPTLPNGSRSLVLASDNNFFATVPTQLLFFELEPQG